MKKKILERNIDGLGGKIVHRLGVYKGWGVFKFSSKAEYIAPYNFYREICV